MSPNLSTWAQDYQINALKLIEQKHAIAYSRLSSYTVAINCCCRKLQNSQLYTKCGFYSIWFI